MGLRPTLTPPPLRAVVERQAPRDLAGLLAQLAAAEAGHRRWAVRDLRGRPEAPAAFGERLRQETDPSVREALFTALAAQPGPASVEALLPLLRSEDATLRNGAIEALGAMPEAVAPRVDALLHDPDPDVRLFTVNLLGDLRHPEVPAWLDRVLRQEVTVNGVAAALEVLAEVGSPRHLPALALARERFAEDPFIAFAAELAQARIEAA